MDMEMTKDKSRMSRRRGLSLVEVLIAIFIISIALGALLNVFSYSLRLTTEAAVNSRNLMAAYAQVARVFFLKDLSSPPSGVQAVPVGGKWNLVFTGSGTLPSPLPLHRYDVGQGWPLWVYRP